MPYTLVRDVPARAANLTPFRTTPYPRIGLCGEGAYVLTPVRSVPKELEDGQARRTADYMSGKGRMSPADAPVYYVTDDGKLLAWVSVDGQTHFTATHDLPLGGGKKYQRHLQMLKAAMPARYEIS